MAPFDKLRAGYAQVDACLANAGAALGILCDQVKGPDGVARGAMSGRGRGAAKRPGENRLSLN